jgi:hypothetical protein
VWFTTNWQGAVTNRSRGLRALQLATRGKREDDGAASLGERGFITLSLSIPKFGSCGSWESTTNRAW